MDLLTLGKTPVSADHPTGSDVRYEPEFEALQAEIDKQGNPAASGGTDWQKVDQLATEILATKSKDLLAASYLAVAQIHLNKAEGLGAGLRLYRDLLEQFWESLFPAKKRMRGRVAAIEWWLEKSESALQSLQIAPLPSETIEAYRKDIQQIDTLLQEYMAHAPLLRPIERIIDSLPIAEKKQAEPKSTPQSETPSPPRAQPAFASKAGPIPQVSLAPEPDEIASVSDAENTVKAVLKNLRRSANYIQEQNLFDPRPYRWRRIAGWFMLQASPPAANGRTQVPLPTNHGTLLTRLNSLRDQGDWEDMVRVAEETFQTAVLWLDLNRFAAEGLENLGEKYTEAHDALCQETAYLVHRVGEIVRLCYADGTPFCDTETRQWLGSIGFGSGTGVPEPVHVSDEEQDEATAKTIKEAKNLAKKKKINDAVSLLHRALQYSFSKQEQLRWRLELSAILLGAEKPALALPHLEGVLDDVELYKLEDWDPKLALQALKMVWRGFNTVGDEQIKAQARQILHRIAKLDPAEALNII